jgi:hypothetical protein
MQIPDSGKNHIVNLKERTCDCTLFEEYKSPCTHAIVACQHRAEDPYELFAEQYTVSAYQQTYKHFLRPFSIENLKSTSGLLPPVFKKQRGRPTTKRIQKGDWRRKKTKCLKCHGTDHNIRKCRFAPAVNGRQQRARERDMSIDSSDFNGSSSGSSGSGLGSGLGSGIDEEALMDQIESDLHHERIARAWEIVNRRQQEQDDVEMGGTGSGLADEDGQDGQNGGGVGGRISGRASGRVGGRVAIPDVVTSPRRTRSGKVRK